jgi:hypothetical protein
MIVQAYKAGKYRLRVTIPKPIYDAFVKYNAESGGDAEKPPFFAFRSKDRDGEPYFTNCDFGLELLFDIPFGHSNEIKHFAKSNVGIAIPSQWAASNLALVEGMALRCEILENTRPSRGSFGKIIGYSIVPV